MPLTELKSELLMTWAACREDHLFIRECQVTLVHRDRELIATSLRALSESKELLARIDGLFRP